MAISGFTIIRNASKYDFPVVESIQSALPLVEEFVVNVGQSEDDTLDLIRSIPSPKIKILETLWDTDLRKDGKVFGLQQDFALSHCKGEWALLLQADEVLHEDDYPIVQEAVQRYDHDSGIQGLVFWMRHFKGDYWSIDPWMYRKATRLIRNTGKVRSVTDGCDFTLDGTNQMIKSSPRGQLIDARVFHYGWVKHPLILEKKLQFQIRMHDGEQLSQEEIDRQAFIRSQFATYDILKEYSGTHPNVMQSRISESRRLRPRKNRWLNPAFYLEVLRHGFKG